MARCFLIALFNVLLLQETYRSNVQLYAVFLSVLQIRDYRKDWDLEVNEPIAGNYYPVSLLCQLSI